MSNRELKALGADSSRSIATSYGRTRANTLTQQKGQGQKGSVADRSQDSHSTSTRTLKKQLEEAEQRESLLLLRVEELEREAEIARLEMELEHMKALDAQRRTFEKDLDNQREEARLERERTDSWIRGITELSRQEKMVYESRLRTLEEEMDVVRKDYESVCQKVSSGVVSEPQIAKYANIGASSSVHMNVPSHCNDDQYGAVCDEHEGDCCPVNSQSAGGLDSPSDPQRVLPRMDRWVLPSAGGRNASPNNSHADSIVSEYSIPTPATHGSSFGQSASGIDSALVQSMNKLLKAQSDILTAQTQAVVIQGLPPLKRFSGDVIDSDEDSFDKWLELLEERAKLAGWTKEHMLYQLKVHLSGNAFQFFRMLPKETQHVYSEVVEQLKKRFRPVDIEELRGLEFHQKMQGAETVEQLGMTLQKLGRRAFPGLKGKEFDRLLKGRFFQALNQKWQRKLGAPKSDESFHDLYDRARILERQYKQISDTAAAVGSKEKEPEKERKLTPIAKQRKAPDSNAGEGATKLQARSQSDSVPNRPRQLVVCRECNRVGHYARDCFQRARGKEESPGKASGKTSRSAVLSASVQDSNPTLDSFSVQQLEQHLAQRKLAEETRQSKETPDSEAQVGTVLSSSRVSEAVGPTPYVTLEVEGVSAAGLVDTGSQSTIISRALLRKVSAQLRASGKPLPTLTLPSVKLFGKDGENGKRELNISAQVELTVAVDGRSVRVPMFVQPQSEQDCLLGMNVIPKLGIRLLRSNGTSVCADVDQCEKPESSTVCLVQTSTLPGRKGRFLDASAPQTKFKEGEEVLFEPDSTVLHQLGLISSDCLLTVGHDGKLLVPLENLHPSNVDLGGAAVIGRVTAVKSISLTADGLDPLEGDVNRSILVEDSKEARQKTLKAKLNVPTDGLEPAEKEQLTKFLLESQDLFSLDDSDLGHTSLVCHTVDTGDHPPIKQPPRRIPFSQRELVSKMIKEMQQKGIVQPSTSAWASPIVLVPKRDNTYRFCVDYRKVNAATKKDVYPLPRIDDILDTLGKSQYFTTLDLSSGFWQIEMDPATRDKSAFSTHCGLHEFVRMPFGMCNAPATFQRLMQVILAGIEWQYCFVYLDDILVCSESFQEHIEHLKSVFDRLRKAGLTLKPKKCFFAQSEVKYLGHVVSSKGVIPDPDKINKVRDFPVPKDVSKVRQFLGLASYYRRFVKQFASIADPLHRLLKKDTEFLWSEDCQASFERLKAALITAPVLAYPKFGEGVSFILETDASLEGLGAVLGQKQDDGHVHPVAYASRSLNPHEKNYSITELETLGLVWAVKHFRPYLLGHHVFVLTDHSACTSLLNSPKPSAKLARWAMIVQEFDLTIKHRSGKSNSNADALSRNPVPQEVSVLAIDTAARDREVELRAEQEKDHELASTLKYLCDGTLPEDENLAKRLVLESSRYAILDGLLHHENPCQPGEWRVVVPASLRSNLMSEMHSGRFSGHFAWRKMYCTMRKRYWWRGMSGDVQRHCQACLKCVTRSGPGRQVKTPLSSIPVGGPFHLMGVDVLQLPVTEAGNKYVVVFADYLTKWVEAFAVKDQSADTIAHLLVEEIFCRHGAPQHLLSDRGANFLSDLVLEVCKILRIRKINTSGYHPQTNGMVEKFNSTLISMISKVAETSGKDWDIQLPFLLFAYRTAVHDSTNESPFYLLYGRDARIPSEDVLNQTISPYTVDVEDYRIDLTEFLVNAWSLAKQSIESAQAKQKKAYDRKAKDHSFQVGDRVMIRMPGVISGKSWKLARPFHGPYRILSVTPTNVEARLVGDVDAESIFVSTERVRFCPKSLPDEVWTGKKKRRNRKRSSPNDAALQEPHRRGGPITRSMTAVHSED